MTFNRVKVINKGELKTMAMTSILESLYLPPSPHTGYRSKHNNVNNIRYQDNEHAKSPLELHERQKLYTHKMRSILL